nr:ribose-phosphate diphosphokinase [Burkholderiales bacterium]
KNAIIVSPDTGGVARARAFAKALNIDMAIIDKRRPKANEAEVMNIIGDIDGKICIIVDDMIDTANTLCKAAEALKKQGAIQVFAYATHAVFSGAVERINASIIDEVVITDTIPIASNALSSKKIRVTSIAALFAETIRRINNEESISLLLND